LAVITSYFVLMKLSLHTHDNCLIPMKPSLYTYQLAVITSYLWNHQFIPKKPSLHTHEFASHPQNHHFIPQKLPRTQPPVASLMECIAHSLIPGLGFEGQSDVRFRHADTVWGNGWHYAAGLNTNTVQKAKVQITGRPCVRCERKTERFNAMTV